MLEFYLARILKRRKSVQKTDLARLISNELKPEARVPSVEDINTALERLRAKDIVNIEKTRGIVRYI